MSKKRVAQIIDEELQKFLKENTIKDIESFKKELLAEMFVDESKQNVEKTNNKRGTLK
tara:strand:+ start:190 stop:363 length:174 start_codon:yes stop_codon:yes gene_type:complete